ncbi:MAG TPA: nucleoside diphosphate kinase regulator [Rhizomicrobium sp.]|jgi:regulator of nucleoside diphosphate kinase
MTAMTNLPSIVMSPQDHERLSNIAQAAQRTVPTVADYLLRELDRAKVTPKDDPCTKRVKMGSHVEFRDNGTGRVRAIQLVYPAEADPQAGRISVLTPIGAALVGLSEGKTIPWVGRSGENRTLTVLKIGADSGPVRYSDM